MSANGHERSVRRRSEMSRAARVGSNRQNVITQTGRRPVSTRKIVRRPPVLTAADRLRIVLESFEAGEQVATVARRHRINAGTLSRWRCRYQAGRLGGAAEQLRTVPVSELAAARQLIRDLERELGRMALENAMLLEAVEYVDLAAVRGHPTATVKKRKK